MSRMIEVLSDDLRAVCEAVQQVAHNEWTMGGGTEVHECRFCGKDFEYDYARNNVAKEHHEQNCPVLIARSIEPLKDKLAGKEKQLDEGGKP